MFFELFILQKKGPLGVVWLASHYEKRLSKANIVETDLQQCAQQIINPKAAFAVRLSGHLLLGCVRIYRKKVELLYADCNEAIVRIRTAFRPGVIDLERATVNTANITYPEVFELELEIPQLDTSNLPAEEDLFTLHVSRSRDITVRGDIDVARGTQTSQAFELGTPEDRTFQADQDLLAPGMMDFEPRDLDLLGRPTDISYPEETGFEPQLLNGSWDQLPHISSDISAEKEAGISLPDLAPRKKIIKKTTKPIFDKATQLTSTQMQKTIRDPSSLLRPVYRALPSGFMERKMRYEKTSDVFSFPVSELFPTNLANIFSRATSIKVIQNLPGELSIPSIEEARADKSLSHELIGGEPGEIYHEPLGYGEDFGESGVYEPGTYEPTTYEPSETRTIERSDSFESQPPIVVTKRTKAMHAFLEKRFNVDGDTLIFQEQMKGKPRRSVAIALLELLSLVSKGLVAVSQKKNYADIVITKKDSFGQLIIDQ